MSTQTKPRVRPNPTKSRCVSVLKHASEGIARPSSSWIARAQASKHLQQFARGTGRQAPRPAPGFRPPAFWSAVNDIAWPASFSPNDACDNSPYFHRRCDSRALACRFLRRRATHVCSNRPGFRLLDIFDVDDLCMAKDIRSSLLHTGSPACRRRLHGNSPLSQWRASSLRSTAREQWCRPRAPLRDRSVGPESDQSPFPRQSSPCRTAPDLE